MAAPYQCNSNDEHLDLEYLTTLKNIKPYITCIMNNHYIELIRVWLEKLSDSHVQDDKVLRNTYLVELGKQIVNGVFAEPFIDPPDDGLLPAFKNHWRLTKDQLQTATANENMDVWTQSISNNVSTQVIVDSTKCSSQTITDDSVMVSNSDSKFFLPQASQKMSPQSQLRDVRGKLTLAHEMCRTPKTVKKKKNKVKKSPNLQSADKGKIADETDCCPGGSEKRFALPYKEVRVYSPLRKIDSGDRKFNETDDSSWCDLTDVSTNATTAFCSGDCDVTSRMFDKDETAQIRELYENKIADLINIIRDLRQENMNLSQHADKYEKDLRNAKADSSLNNLTNEVECLKTQLQELIDIKTSLQNGHFGISSEWQSTVSGLHKKLALLQRKNNELKLENNDLTKKIEEQDSEKRKELMNQKKKASDFHNKETDMLKQIHARAITDMETKYIQKMGEQDIDFHTRLDEIKDSYENRFNNLKDDYDNRVGVLKEDYETRICNFSMEYEKALSSKDAEIDRLEIMLQEQCVRMQEEVHLIRSQIESNMFSSNESNLEKIAFLQKCILKMEKLYHKSEKENQKQMNKLKRELEFRDKSNQLALTTQRADLLSHTVSGKQNEIDLVVSQLEEYYKKKLIELQQRAFEEKRQDSKLIAELKDQLAKLNNEY